MNTVSLKEIVDKFNLTAFYLPDGWEKYQIKGVIDDNRLTEENYIFLATQGGKVHPIIFADKAISCGIKAIFTDSKGADFLNSPDLKNQISLIKNSNIAVFVAEKLYEKQAEIADFVFSSPSNTFKKFAVTGTNGKTSTSYIYEYCMKMLGHKTGLIGTVETDNGKVRTMSNLTTPQGSRLQQLFSQMRDNNVEYLSMEFSSHAIGLGRINGLYYDVVAFTNLTQDHLDFHSTMQEYFETKEQLFTPERCAKAIVCIDDDYGKKLYEKQKRKGVYSFSIKDQSQSDEYRKGFYITNIQKNVLSGKDNNDRYEKYKSSLVITSFDFHLPSAYGEKVTVRTDLQGDFNISNLGLALSSVIVSDIDIKIFKEILYKNLLSPVIPGRVEKIADEPLVIVDYAHNPHAMEVLFNSFISSNNTVDNYMGHTSEKNNKGKMVCVFGADGMRDIGKRPIMAEIASKYCDKVVITNGELYGEDQFNILNDTLKTIPNDELKSKFIIQLDRYKAIYETIYSADSNDIILILGRGHEKCFELPDGSKIELDDREVARFAMEERNV